MGFTHEAELGQAPTYWWQITRDIVDEGRYNGTIGPRGYDTYIDHDPITFSLYDDDGECYAIGTLYGDYSGFEPLDDFGAPNWGCTYIKLKNSKTGEMEIL